MTLISTTLKAHQLLSDKNTLLSFTGQFDHLLTTLLLINVKNKLSSTEVASGVEKRVYNVLVECIENVSKHSFQGSKNENIATLLLTKSDTKYTIVTGNYIPNSDIPYLKEKLEVIINSSPLELKQMYREKILGKRTDDNNAGLGIIDIAIKTGNQIKYEFTPLTDSTTFYLLQTEINIQK
ncbi:MAG: SiaB family protein kinase [Bacteroidota bacterium]